MKHEAIASIVRAGWRVVSAAALLSILLLFAVEPAESKGGKTEVDVEIVFAVDISYSMDPDEQRLQRDGYIQAVVSPEFLQAVKAGQNGKIAVAYMQWASSFDQDVTVAWTLIDGLATARAFADKLAEAPFSPGASHVDFGRHRHRDEDVRE